MGNLHVKSECYDFVDLNQAKFYSYSKLIWIRTITFYVFSCMEWEHFLIVEEAQA